MIETKLNIPQIDGEVMDPSGRVVGAELLCRGHTAQRQREREMERASKGAQRLGLVVDDLSKRKRRLLAAVTDLPKPFPTNSEQRDGNPLGRHLAALRVRLDWLVRLEEYRGDDQRGVHQNRAERNALIFILGEQAERAGAEAARPVPAPSTKYGQPYIEHAEAMAEAAIEAGYVLTDIAKPCLLMHRDDGDIAPMSVPVATWFTVRAFMRGKEQ